MEPVILTELRALRRAIEGGTSVEKVIWRQGTAPPTDLWTLVRKHKLPFQQVPPSALPKGAAWAAFLSPIRLYTLVDWLQAPPGGIALALIGLTDPHNVGAICRSAAAFGVEWILLRAEGSPLLSNEALWRASAGALPHLKIVRERRPLEALRQLQGKGWQLLATVPPAPDIPSYRTYPWKPATLLLIGSESKGLPQPYLQISDAALTVPHEPVVESLNVSAATAILLAERYAALKAQ